MFHIFCQVKHFLSSQAFFVLNTIFVRKTAPFHPFSPFFILFHPFSSKKAEKGRKRQKKAGKGYQVSFIICPIAFFKKKKKGQGRDTRKGRKQKK